MESSVTEASDLTILGLSGKAHSGFITLLTYELITVEAGGRSRQKKKKKSSKFKNRNINFNDSNVFLLQSFVQGCRLQRSA